MRFKNIFEQAYADMRATAGKTIVFITAEKADNLSTLSTLLQFKKQIKVELPERGDRKRMLESLVPQHIADSVDLLEVAKYLQGKTFRDIKQTIQKIKRKLPAYFKENVLAGDGLT